MKAILTLLAMAFLLVLAGHVSATPYVVCDSYVAPADVPDYFKYSLDGGTDIQLAPWSGTAGTPPQTFTNACHFDVGSVSVGAHTLSIRACNAADPVWNVPEACSAATPFPFQRPASGGSPPTVVSGGRLVP